MVLITPSPQLNGSTTASQMDSGPNMLLRQLMSNASTHLPGNTTPLTEFRQPLQVQSHLEMPGILVQLGHIQRT